MKNILYLSYDGMTDPLGQSQVLPYLKGLTESGYQFTLISFEKPERFAQSKNLIQKICNENKIIWKPLIYTKSPPVLSTLKDVWRMKKLARQLHQKENFDVIHCRSYMSALVGLEMKEKYRVKFIFDMRGFWADERVEGGLWSLKNPIYKTIYNYFKRKEKEFFSKADYTVSLTETGKEEIHSWDLPNQPIPIQVIPCCADLIHFSRKNIDHQLLHRLKDDYEIYSENLVISYLGSIGTWYMLEEMLFFFSRLLIKYPKAKFLFITRDEKREIIQKAAEIGVEESNLIITPANRAEVPTYLALSHLSIFFIRPVFSKKASSPTKQGEVMSMGIPIICNDNVGDTGSIIKETKAGKVVTVFTAGSFDLLIENIDELIKLPPENGKKGAETYYSLKKGIASYSEVYKKCLK